MAPKRNRNGEFKKSGEIVTKGMVRSMLKSKISSSLEHMHYQVTATGAATTAGNMYTVSQGIVQGTALNQRDGDVIRPELIELNMSVKGVSTVAAPGSVAYRVILFQDMLNTGVVPLATDILTIASPLSPYDAENRQQNRFKFLYDKIHDISSPYATNTVKVIQTSIRTKGAIHYNGATSVAASNGKGALWLFTVVDSVALVTVTENWYIDIKYTDA